MPYVNRNVCHPLRESFLNHLQVFNDSNQPLDRRDSHSSTSAVDSPLCRPLHSLSAARQVPLRPLDDDEAGQQGSVEAAVRSFHSYGQARCGNNVGAGNGIDAMDRVGSAPSHLGTKRTSRPVAARALTLLSVRNNPAAQLIGHGLLPAAGGQASTLCCCGPRPRPHNPWRKAALQPQPQPRRRLRRRSSRP